MLYWLIALAALLGVWLNIHRHVASFWIWSVTNAAWACVDWAHGIYPQAALQALGLAFQVGQLNITYGRLWIVVFSLVVFAALILLLRKTPLGLCMRAVTQNRPMASAMGIRTPRVDALTFGLGSGIEAGVAVTIAAANSPAWAAPPLAFATIMAICRNPVLAMVPVFSLAVTRV